VKTQDFTYLAAKNFLCYGPDGIELYLKSFGNIIVVLGNNLDNLEVEQERVSSNGSGKSSIAEILVYTLYGRTIRQPKKLTHDNLINNKVGKGLCTEVRWGDYRVVRTRQPNSVKVWESPGGDWSQLGNKKWEKEHQISRGKGMKETEKMIVNLLGLTYTAFVNVVVFTDNKLGCYLECEAAEKREIVDNLFSVDKYRGFAETANKAKNAYRAKIKLLKQEYESLLEQVNRCKSREKEVTKQEEEWAKTKREELKSLLEELRDAKDQLESSDEGDLVLKYHEAQDRIKKLTEEIPDLEYKKAQLEEASTMAQEKLEASKKSRHKKSLELQETENSQKRTLIEIQNRRNKIEDIESGDGTRCDKCYAIVSEENYGSFVQILKNEIVHFEGVTEGLAKQQKQTNEKLKSFNTSIERLDEVLKIAKDKLTTLSKKISSHHNELNRWKNVEKPEVEVHHAVLRKQIDTLSERIRAKEKELEGDSPYVQIMESAKEETVEKSKERDNKEKELNLAEKDLPYYEFYVYAFGEKGIRRFVINGIVPALNSKMADWMEILIDGKVRMTFNDELDETIERNPADGEPYVYPQMSGGEKQQLNLSVAQGFAHVMILSSGSSPSLVFLDEVATNIDQRGVVAIYNMILELSKEKQVFVTTHDRDLLDMLNGCEKILLEKKDGFTRLVSP
jgi:DNA repair exonuclease SbcCD ATPase subunit